MAGVVLDHDTFVNDWRSSFMRRTRNPKAGDRIDQAFPYKGELHYAGPTIFSNSMPHVPNIARVCMEEVAACDVLFAWFPNKDARGTPAEVGAAYALKKPIFCAFASIDISDHLYFVRQLATARIVRKPVESAWGDFLTFLDDLNVNQTSITFVSAPLESET
jgi:hypothetical protein